ncbi:unnamed protein product, partial [Discosporangium mesarthrocarpum]
LGFHCSRDCSTYHRLDYYPLGPMGFLEGLCDEDISWSQFWTFKGECSVSIIGSVVPFLYAVVLAIVVFGMWLASSRGGSRSRVGRGFLGADESLNRFLDKGEGEEESKGNGADSPLLGHNRGELPFHAERGEGIEKTFKKGTSLHFGKLLLYSLQVSYHLGVGGYDLVDGHADDPYKYASNVLLALAWVFHCITETTHHAIRERRRNLLAQAVFPALAFGFMLWELLEEDGFGNIEPDELAAWDLGVLLLILFFDLWSCIRRVPVKYYTHTNPEFMSGLWSYLNLNWYTEVIIRGYNKQLQPEDLPEMVDSDRSSNVWERYSRLLYPWAGGGDGLVPEGESLHVGMSMVRLGGKRYILQAAVAFVSAFTQLIPPLALNSVTNYMESYDPEDESSKGVPLIVVLSIVGIFAGQLMANYTDLITFKIGRRMGLRARSAIVSAVFHKAMSLDMSSANAGQLQNHISVDAENMLNLMVFQMFMGGVVIRLVACVVLLFWVLGLSAISGLSLIFLTLPVNKVLVGKLKNLQLKLMKRRDDRMSVINESINGIRIIKLFAWEPNFLAKIRDAREREMMLLRAYMFTLGCFMVVVKSSPSLIGLVTFLVHTKAFGYTLTAANGFSALALFNQLRMPLIALPDTINYYIQALVSFKRMEAFLGNKDDDVRTLDLASHKDKASDKQCPELARGQLRIENGTFRWRQAGELDKPTLSDINVDIKPGQLVCVYGPTGSGKSSLLMAFLQELVTLKGRSLMNGTVSYASQKAWIQNATLRDNILFGCPYNAQRYEMVLQACALKPDLEILEGGDLTEIGEKGINLSGGQQQRVSLARAVYANADILLLDDVLSAVDAHVGKHLFDKCIRKALHGKTRVLVTHQVSMTARFADQIIVIDEGGNIKEQGTYAEVAASGEANLAAAIEAPGGEAGTLLRQRSSFSFSDDKAQKEVDNSRGGKDESKAKIIDVEATAVGRPKAALYLSYFRFCGGVWFGIMWAALSSIWQGLTVAQGFTLKTWINQLTEESNGGPSANRGMWVYITISILGFLSLLLRTLLITSGSLNASKVVHSKMSTSVFGAPVGWYDSTPLGRIFNRFSSDVVTLDKDLMNDISSYTDLLLGVVGVVVVIAVAIPILTIALVPILALCYYFSYRYLQTSRQLKRLEAITRSPLYAHFGESVNGVSTIRAYKAEDRFIKKSEECMDALNNAHMSLWCSNYWLSNRVRWIGATVCGLVAAFLVAQVANIDGSTGGLVITYSLNFTLTVVFTVRLHAQMEMSVNSIERLDEYCKLPQEAPAIVPDKRPQGTWPSTGEVDVKNLTLKYASASEPILHGVTFHVPPQTRVGIVGRTGAGKSSLMNALFRMVEPQPGSSVVIDGMDVLTMGLQDLRRRLAIIPQDPTLFEGTVRSNVDPFNEYTDAQVWDALSQCRLHSFTSSQQEKLQYPVSAGGSNLSVGQKQLMCMARALLRRAAVLVMDEATANV